MFLPKGIQIPIADIAGKKYGLIDPERAAKRIEIKLSKYLNFFFLKLLFLKIIWLFKEIEKKDVAVKLKCWYPLNKIGRQIYSTHIKLTRFFEFEIFSKLLLIFIEFKAQYKNNAELRYPK